MLLLNKREERTAVRGGGGHLYEKNTCYLRTEKHREIGHEHREFNLNPNVATLSCLSGLQVEYLASDTGVFESSLRHCSSDKTNFFPKSGKLGP